MDWEEVIQDYDGCEFCETTYYEYDTGYSEVGCSLIGDPHKINCDPDCCPLSFKYKNIT